MFLQNEFRAESRCSGSASAADAAGGVTCEGCEVFFLAQSMRKEVF